MHINALWVLSSCSNRSADTKNKTGVLAQAYSCTEVNIISLALSCETGPMSCAANTQTGLLSFPLCSIESPESIDY